MPRINGQPTMPEAVRLALTDAPQTPAQIHAARCDIMGIEHGSGCGATIAFLMHLVTRRQVVAVPDSAGEFRFHWA